MSRVASGSEGRYSHAICMNHNRSMFSSRCSKSQHGNCSGRVDKKRNSTGICLCDCHDEVIEN